MGTYNEKIGSLFGGLRNGIINVGENIDDYTNERRETLTQEEILREAAGIDNGNTVDRHVMDINGDGEVRANDARLFGRRQQGLPDEDVGNSWMQYQRNHAQAPGEFQYSGQAELDSLLADILGGGEGFSYDSEKDPLYNQYAAQYQRGGDMAMRDTMGQAAAMTGGYGNSYAQSVGQQTYNAYMQELAGQIPEMYDRAYGQYQDNQNEKYNRYSLLANERDTAYGQHRDDVADWQVRDAQLYDRTFSEASALASTGDFSLLGELLGADLSGYQNDYNQSQKLAAASELYSATGDLSGFEALGIDTSEIVRNRKFSEALQLAELGDYSALEALGYDTSMIEAMLNAQIYNSTDGVYNSIDDFRPASNGNANNTPEGIDVGTETGAGAVGGSGGGSGSDGASGNYGTGGNTNAGGNAVGTPGDIAPAVNTGTDYTHLFDNEEDEQAALRLLREQGLI